MTDYGHHTAALSAEFDIPAARYWAAVSDWMAIERFLPDDHPMKFSKIVLDPRCVPGELPCTRLVHIDKARLPPGVAPDSLPDVFSETLIHADPVVRVMIFSVDGGGLLGFRNYYGVYEIDELSDGRCRASIATRFDLPTGADAAAIVASLQDIYRSVLGGIAKQIQRSGAAA